MTEGNRYGRYIGTTDEPLCPVGRTLLQGITYPVPEKIYVSPLRRCKETAALLFPEQSQEVIRELRECDFGDFENKNYQELSLNQDYQDWIDSCGLLPFPGGESREAFRERCLRGFEAAISDCICGNVSMAAMVTHGGTIMTIMEQYAVPARSFYDWLVKNGGGYLVEIDREKWRRKVRELHLCKEAGLE